MRLDVLLHGLGHTTAFFGGVPLGGWASYVVAQWITLRVHGLAEFDLLEPHAVPVVTAMFLGGGITPFLLGFAFLRFTRLRCSECPGRLRVLRPVFDKRRSIYRCEACRAESSFLELVQGR